MSTRIFGIFCLCATLTLFVGCGTATTSKTTPRADTSDSGATDEDSDAPADTDDKDAHGQSDADVAVSTDAADPTKDAAPDVPKDAGGSGDDVDAQGPSDATTDQPDISAVPDGSKPKLLPLPGCAKANCANCKSKCPAAPVCGPDTKTYYNDCEAICSLQLFDGLDPKLWAAQACPACGGCTINDVPEAGFGTDPLAGWCVTLSNGAKMTVSMECEAKCLDSVTKPTLGACKSVCSQPKDNGGAGCNFTKYMPVCGGDAKTYFSDCHLQACNLQGCFPVGENVKSAACTPGTMTTECQGECFDAAKTPDCDKACDPVCAITIAQKGQTYRNACIAAVDGAKVATCDGISTTKADICSATLYKSKGCCPDVDYSVLKQVCASLTTGSGADTWVTFRSQSEYQCLSAGTQGWNKQYNGPCICNCNNDDKPVCGDDGLTYANACQATCYNGKQFNYKTGPC